MYVGKTKALISFAVTAKLICVFVFAYAKSRFSHDEAHYLSGRTVPALNRGRSSTNDQSHINFSFPCYQCDECGYTCAAPSILEIHKRRHSGLKPYICVICCKGFSQSGSMNRHLLKKHKISK